MQLVQWNQTCEEESCETVKQCLQDVAVFGNPFASATIASLLRGMKLPFLFWRLAPFLNSLPIRRSLFILRPCRGIRSPVFIFKTKCQQLLSKLLHFISPNIVTNSLLMCFRSGPEIKNAGSFLEFNRFQVFRFMLDRSEAKFWNRKMREALRKTTVFTNNSSSWNKFLNQSWTKKRRKLYGIQLFSAFQFHVWQIRNQNWN